MTTIGDTKILLQCSLERANEACENYNNSMWMDNQVTVSLIHTNGMIPQPSKKE